VVKESKINIYEVVFLSVVSEHLDYLELIPHLQIYWESPWGGMITIRISSTLR